MHKYNIQILTFQLSVVVLKARFSDNTNNLAKLY